MTYRKVSKVIIVIFAGFLAGCGLTPTGQAVRVAIDEYGQKIADAELENIEFVLCRGITVGAFTRRYGTQPKKAEAWRTICSTEAAAP